MPARWIALPSIAILGLLTAAIAGGDFRVTRTVKIGGRGNRDMIVLDPVGRRLFIPRSGRMDVMDIATGKVVATLGQIHIPHGVALVPELNRGFVTCSGDDSLAVFDLTTIKMIVKINVGDKPDAIAYDSFTKKVLCFNSVGRECAVVDPAFDPAQPAKAIIARVPLEGPPEAGVSDGQGHIYVDVLNVNKVAAIDCKTWKVDAAYPLGEGQNPCGLAIDPKTRVLFCGCTNGKLVSLNCDSGKILDTVPMVQGTDGCEFDAGLGLVFSSCNDGFLEVFHEEADGKCPLVQHLTTEYGARTLALDESRHVVYVVTTDFNYVEPKFLSTPIGSTFRVLTIQQ